MAFLTLLIKVHSLIGMHSRSGAPVDAKNPSEEAFLLGQQVNKAEKEAAEFIERIMKKGKK
ncbi:hypothetical protein [Erwinia psidii]|uniref:Uncharacterized protein n=1 Tax=Erwinia psidii TaxID=69224 RepID=A0A3N6TPF1_9GAMM|nr:hypothetical protein [Erwinia psidii]MCX8958131.1 hypothetical protein [Erwinia psidii]MCX8962532.1 hypothetical protein [Erwinia psidii]MCX8966335.1 hypothetical protein [Erwinia psidii]RQM37112.1 hypothetical protein EB241_17070 [Erwinia psidii]